MVSLPRALLIDLDDTLLDDSSTTAGCWTDSLAHFAARLDGVEPGAVMTAIRESSSWFWSDAERHRSGRLDLHVATRTLLARALADLGTDDTELASDLARHYRALRSERAALFPGVIEALASLRKQGVKLGMMTNGAAGPQRAKIERYGLAPYFDHIVIEGELGAGKPDRRVFDTLLDALACDPADTWAIGDNLEFDVLAPMQLGIHGIWIDAAGRGWADGNGPPDRIVAAFTEVLGRG